MDQSLIFTAIKWTLIVFLAGFIGYFGKYLGKILITKLHEKRGQKSLDLGNKANKADGSDKIKELKDLSKDFKTKDKTKEDIELEKERIKLEKKKLKLQKKMLKLKKEEEL